MAEPNVLIAFRLDVKHPVKLLWLANDGSPGNGYKAQVTAINLLDGTRLPMDNTAILEQTVPDPLAGSGLYTLTFSGMVGFAHDHPDRAAIEKITDQQVNYELEFFHDETGRRAVEDTDFRILDKPRGSAVKVTRNDKR